MSLAFLSILIVSSAHPESWTARIDVDGTWGIGSQMYLGAQVHALAQREIWSKKSLRGTLDTSLRVSYGNEAMFLAPWLDPETTTAKNQRIQIQAGIGHALHFGPKQKWAFGVHFLAGYNGYFQNVMLRYADEDFQAEGSRSLHSAVFSGEVNLAYRASKHVGINLAVGAPLPTQSSYIITMVQTALGISFYFDGKH